MLQAEQHIKKGVQEKGRPSYVWARQVLSDQCVIVDCAVHHPIKDFCMEPTGHYVLIRVDSKAKRLEVAICNKKHEIIAVFRGRKCQDLYEGIFKFEQEHKLKWFKDKGHIAYLGKELKKAELVLRSGKDDYFQE